MRAIKVRYPHTRWIGIPAPERVAWYSKGRFASTLLCAAANRPLSTHNGPTVPASSFPVCGRSCSPSRLGEPRSSRLYRWREQVTPARRGRRKAETANEPAPARHVSMTWAQRLKRVFKIDILTCEHCGGAVKVIASIEDPAVIKKILDHLARRAEAATPASRPFARAPPQTALPDLRELG